MIDLPGDFVINSTLTIGTVYKLNAPELISTTVPHYFIVMGIDSDDNYLVLCTTTNKESYFDRNNLDYNGLVCIQPDGANGLTEETYVNCNDNYPISRTSLTEKSITGKLAFKGTITYNHYDQIRTGIVKSHVNDLPKYLLVHPED